MQRVGSSGGPLKITDPAAFSRLMSEMKLKAQKQEEAEQKREAERASREGAAYKSREERAKEARQAKDDFEAGEEVRTLESKFDPSKNYYEILGLDRAASSAEVKKAYKKLTLLYHPDKLKGENDEHKEAITLKFRQVTEAFDIISDEEKRSVYDKIRDYQDTNPGKGLPVLSPEEAKLMRSGAGELSKLRRMGPKLAKHAPIEKEVILSLPKLNSGCTKSVSVERRRVDYNGKPFIHTKIFHLVIRKGSQEGDKLVFEEEGEESVDTHPGDLIFILKAKPHPVFKRSGPKDLEVFAAAVSQGSVKVCVDIETIRGSKRALHGSTLVAALENQGRGGVWKAHVPGQGLFDPQGPWDRPCGDLIVHVRYPAVLLSECSIKNCIKMRSVHLIGGDDSRVAAALAGGAIVASLVHERESYEMVFGKEKQAPKIVCLYSKVVNTPSSAVISMLEAFQQRLHGCCEVITAPMESILDDELVALCTADVVIIQHSCCETDAYNSIEDIIFQRFCMGAHIVAVGDGCALLSRRILPWYAIAVGSVHEGWANIVRHVERTSSGKPTTIVGIPPDSWCIVDPWIGACEMVAAPSKEVLIALARWSAEHSFLDEGGTAEEAEDDFGFFIAATQKVLT